MGYRDKIVKGKNRFTIEQRFHGRAPKIKQVSRG